MYAFLLGSKLYNTTLTSVMLVNMRPLASSDVFNVDSNGLQRYFMEVVMILEEIGYVTLWLKMSRSVPPNLVLPHLVHRR